MYWSPTNSQASLSFNNVAIMIVDVTDVSLLPKKVRFVIFSLTVLTNFFLAYFQPVGEKLGFMGR